MQGMNGVRIFVAEDEFLLVTMLVDDLNAMGCTVVGPYTSLEAAVQAARSEEFELAVLDINLRGEMIYPVAEELARRRIPFLFLSGYGATDLPDRFSAAPIVSKPYDPKILLGEVQRICASVARERGSDAAGAPANPT